MERIRNLGLPSISIVVPVYNGRTTIRECIESLLSQDYPYDSYEIIIVDNNSTDETPQIVKDYPVRLEFERGRQTSYAARNRGIQRAQGEIVAFTDADCIADPHWLAEIVSPFADSAVGAVNGVMLDSDPTNEVESFLVGLRPFAGKGESTAYPILITGSAAVRRSCLLEIGMFNENLYTGGDVDLGWRIHLDTEYKVVESSSAIVFHKHRSTLGAMYKQFHRHGFGEILLDSMYHQYPDYFRPPIKQFRRMILQVIACINYMRAIIVRTIGLMLGRDLEDKRREAFFWLVVESANLMGKMKGLWVTRFFCRNPRNLDIEDPKER